MRLRRKKQPRIGLALGSGGAKGLSHIAFLKAFDDLGVRPSIIAGTSIGAMMGAAYAAGLTGAAIESIVEDMGIRDIRRMLDLTVFTGSGMVRGNGVRTFLGDHLPASFSELKIPLRVVATDFWNRREVVFSEGDLLSAVMASISLPIIFEPLNLDGKVLIDGGAVNPLPYDLIRPECDILVAVDVSGEKVPDGGRKVPTMFENIMSSFQIMQASIVRCKMAASRPDLLVRPELKNVQLLEFHRKDAIMKAVEKDAMKFREDLVRLVEEWR